jgi:hypothetical protein
MGASCMMACGGTAQTCEDDCVSSCESCMPSRCGSCQ